ncbi:hypothetical protein AAG906_037019 [Vitis piasezkii]
MFGEQANVIGQVKPNSNESSKFFMEAESTMISTMAQPSQQVSSLEQAIVNLRRLWEILLENKNPSMLSSVKELTV